MYLKKSKYPRRLLAAVATIPGMLGCSAPTPTLQERCSTPSESVRIVRDEVGVPHVFAATIPDAAWGQGYAQASDRLLQIDLLRRTASGRQSELMGEKTLELDRLVRALDLVGAAKASWEALPDDSRCQVYAYAAGVNRFLDDMQAGRNGAVRSAALDALDPAYVPPRWEPLDVVGVATAAVFSLSSQIEADLVLTALRVLEGDETFARYVHFAGLTEAYTLTDPAQDRPIAAVTEDTTSPAPTWQSQAARLQNKPEIAQAVATFWQRLQALRTALPPTASNNWAVTAARTKRGHAFLASDPHGAITIPSSFHEIHLVVSEPALNVYGIAVAGGPMVHIGHNGYGAWAFTNLGADVGDLYEETLNEDETAVWRDNAWLPVTARTEVLLVRPAGAAVAAAEAQELELIDVPGHGPILNPVLPQPLPLLFGTRTVSYRWVGAGPTLEARALANLAQVLNWADFVDNAQDWHVGGQNTLYASQDGDIGYYATSLLPQRPWIKQYSPIEPVPGDGSAEWTGWAAREDIRQLYNPAWGFLATANGDPTGLLADGELQKDNYLGYVLDFGYRTHRLKSELYRLTQDNAVDMTAMEALQTDVYIGMADSFLPRLYRAANNLTATTDAADLDPLLALLRNWDHIAAVDSAGAAVFHQWIIRLLADYVAPPLYEALRPLFLGNAQFAIRALAAAIRNADPEIFPHGVDRAMLQALASAKTDLETFFDTADTGKWRWGAMHLRSLEHPLGGDFNRGPLPSSGGFAVVNRSSFRYLDENGIAGPPYTITDGADMRFLVELENGVWTTRIRMPAGSSGNPDSPHYDDQFQAWVDGTYRTAHYLPSAVEAAKVSERILVP